MRHNPIYDTWTAICEGRKARPNDHGNSRNNSSLDGRVSGAETLGTEALGTETLRTETLGTETLGTETLRTETLGTETLGTETLGTETLGTEKRLEAGAEKGMKISRRCPFCEGHEPETPAEVDVLSRGSTDLRAGESGEFPENGLKSFRDEEETLDNYRKPNAPGWLVRAIPNRYPFVVPDTERTVQRFGPYVQTPNLGKQEVLAEVPFHGTKLAELTETEFQYLVYFYHRRLHQLRKEGRWKYVQIFKNQGKMAGASLQHLHSQVAALAFVPPAVQREAAFLHEYAQKTGRCWHCDVLEYELREKWRLVLESEYFGVFCPFASRYAGEIWILPKKHHSCFLQFPRVALNDLAALFRDVILRLEKVLPECDFNLVLKNSPWEFTAKGAQADSHFHWRLEICPRLTFQAGFELGTGCFVNPISPEAMASAMGCGKPIAR